MNTIQKIMVGIGIAAVPFLGSCGKDDPATCNFATELEAELNVVIAAGNTYSQNPTTANCLSYKSSLQSYFNALQGYESCAFNAGQGAQWQASLDQQQAAVNAIQC